jgi:predicted phosphodiesterase
MPNDRLTFVHLSDIHFVKGFSSTSPFDLDRAVREALIADARNLRPQLEPVSGILITGDIAYAGKSSEYQTALEWLAELADALGCQPEYMWCVPGNHDVDHSVLKENTAIGAMHQSIRKSANPDQELRDHLENQNAGMLFSPLKAYNEEFAARLDCLTRPKQPWWTDDLALNDGSTLRLRGINSAICSGLRDDENEDNKLFVGRAQTEYGRQEGVEYLTLCHHPISWLIDGEGTEEALMAYSRIQLFGHKHVQKANRIDETLWLTAGAVHPERDKRPWIPRYNYLSISIEHEGKDRIMSVDLYARVWHQPDRLFTREQGTDENFKNYKLELQERRPKMIAEQQESEARSEPPANQAGDNVKSGMNLNKKKLLFKFIGLPHHTKVAIMRKFGLWEESDESLPDTDVFVACFERADKKGVLDAVWNEVDGLSGQRP